MFTFAMLRIDSCCTNCHIVQNSLHADWTPIITGIDANIEYTVVALSHRTGQLIYHRKDHEMTPYWCIIFGSMPNPQFS